MPGHNDHLALANFIIPGEVSCRHGIRETSIRFVAIHPRAVRASAVMRGDGFSNFDRAVGDAKACFCPDPQ